MTSATVLFLPGSLCDKRLFTHQLQAIGDLWQVDVADFVGAQPVAGESSIETMAATALRSVPGPLILVGLSMGAIVAVEMATQDPARIVAMALFDTNLAAPDQAQLETRRRWADVVAAGRFDCVVDELMPAMTVNAVSNGNLIRAMAHNVGPNGFLAQNAALLHRPDRRPLVGELNIPVLIVSGSEDGVCPPEIHDQLAKSAGQSQLCSIDGAGHLSTIDAPEQATKILQRWLKKLGPSGG